MQEVLQPLSDRVGFHCDCSHGWASADAYVVGRGGFCIPVRGKILSLLGGTGMHATEGRQAGRREKGGDQGNSLGRCDMEASDDGADIIFIQASYFESLHLASSNDAQSELSLIVQIQLTKARGDERILSFDQLCKRTNSRPIIRGGKGTNVFAMLQTFSEIFRKKPSSSIDSS